ncbi:MAG TPA: GNAT family N-acetyltransferase [Clostridia bacterium]|nr:GNAT family N-acetyltransferase [Clostridia bacterium]
MLKDTINRQGFIIKAKRLTLVPISDVHAEAYFKEFTHEITRYLFPKPFSCVKNVRKFISDAQAFRVLGEELVLVLLDVEGAFLGSLEARNLTSPTPEVGLWLKKDAQGLGYGKEALTTLLQFLRENAEIDFFVYEADRRNPASMKLAASLGGEFQCAYEVESAIGELLRLKLFYIT